MFIDPLEMHKYASSEKETREQKIKDAANAYNRGIYSNVYTACIAYGISKLSAAEQTYLSSLIK